MKQRFFEQLGRPRWARLEQMLDALESGSAGDTADFPHLYRRVCQDLALARDRGFGRELVEDLNGLALRGHRHLYQARVTPSRAIARFASHDFPRAVREEWRLLLGTHVLFYGSALLLGYLVWHKPDLIYSFVGPDFVARIEEMYDPANARVGPRGADDDVMMFGFYIWNNVGIAFRTFASGLVFGLGTLFVLTFNGVFFGTIASHLLRIGSGSTFFPFVIGHGAFELTAIVLSGVAGMRLGLALLAPGLRTRGQALRDAARGALPIVYGAAGMLLIAAGVEAFWSPLPMPAAVKYSVGAACWIFVAAYLALSGREPARAD